VSCPCRQDKAVSRRNLEQAAVRPADQQGCRSALDAQHFMGAGVVVLVIENAVCPDPGPAVSGKQRFKVIAIVERDLVMQDGKPLIVGYPIARLEHDCLKFHGRSPYDEAGSSLSSFKDGRNVSTSRRSRSEIVATRSFQNRAASGGSPSQSREEPILSSITATRRPPSRRYSSASSFDAFSMNSPHLLVARSRNYRARPSFRSQPCGAWMGNVITGFLRVCSQKVRVPECVNAFQDWDFRSRS
jgi:hypothetical protein